ncbi:hypothetical protein NA57DRAFT_36221 [Rhizodiscina lignyota]|uniref:Uncharacterized protein n=1 Tax=Rhizodiscina lignyota TaxID=1504668 RepID=A0A9P4M7W5_9PEZI|nr:hypothetical protein NA57DRAFT_36221 [Rhizodiscina lignyota]
MGAIAIFLAVYEGRPLPEWPLGLTINSYVSVFGSFAKAALLLPTAEALGQLKWNWFATRGRDVNDFQTFDEATRGPWGSFMLILRTRGRALSTIGAAVMLLSIALDPFFQQIVVFPLRSVPVKEAMLPRSVVYQWDSLIPATVHEMGSELFTPDVSMNYFVTPLLYSNESSKEPDLKVQCPTGNCQFPAFETLGVCSECADISDLLSFRCMPTPVNWKSSVVDYSQEWAANTTTNVNKKVPAPETCGFFLNGTSASPVLVSGYENSANESEVLVGRTLVLNAPYVGNTCHYDGSMHFKDIPLALLDVMIIATPGGYDGVKTNTRPLAQECNLHWCVKKVQASVLNGEYNESVVAKYDNRTKMSSPEWHVKDMDDGSPDYYIYDVPSIRPPGSNTTFGPSSNDTQFDEIIVFWSSPLQAFTTSKARNSTPTVRYEDDPVGPPDLVQLPSNPWLTGNNWTAQLDRIAGVMTNVMRSSSYGTEMVEGIALSPQTYVHIRWVWFSLPLVLLFSSLAFLVAAILHSRSGDVDVWKNSALAILMHGLREDLIKEKDNMQTTVRRRRNEPRLIVRLRGRKGRWRFSKHVSSQ